MIEAEQTAEALSPLHVGVRTCRRWGSLQEPVAESLIPLAMVVRDVLAHEETEVPLAELATTNRLAAIDPAIRRPGRFDARSFVR